MKCCSKVARINILSVSALSPQGQIQGTPESVFSPVPSITLCSLISHRDLCTDLLHPETGMNKKGLGEREKVASPCLSQTLCDLHTIKKVCRAL